MNKLTADKCREFISVFKSLEKEGHLALTSGYHLQALEIALPILEQQEQGDGWNEWRGGEQPVADDVIVKVTCRGGDRFGPDSASCFEWEHYVPGPDGYDIIAYRIIPEQSTNQNGEQ